MRRTLSIATLAATMALGMTGAADAAITGSSMRSLAAVEGEEVPRDRIVLFQADGACNEGAYTITINWGDGVSSLGDIKFSDPLVGSDLADRSCTYGVEGRHTYNRPGAFALTAQICGPDGCVGSAGGIATVSNAAVKGEAASFPAVAGQQVSVPQVAEFNHDNRTTQSTQFTSVIDWGDGSTSPGPVSGSEGRFGVSGQHTYAAPGNYTVVVTLLQGGAPVAVSDAGTAVVSAAGAVPVQQGAASRNVAFRPGLRLRSSVVRRKSLRKGLPITVSLPAATRRLSVNVVRATGARRLGTVSVRVTGGTVVNGVRQVNLRVKLSKKLQRRMKAGLYALQFRVGNSGTISGAFRVRR